MQTLKNVAQTNSLCQKTQAPSLQYKRQKKGRYPKEYLPEVFSDCVLNAHSHGDNWNCCLYGHHNGVSLHGDGIRFLTDIKHVRPPINEGSEQIIPRMHSTTGDRVVERP